MIAPETINELATALAKAQGALEDASKDATNPHFRSRYATLASVREAIRKPLSDNGLSYVQFVDSLDMGSQVEIITFLMHTSGQNLWSTLHLPTTKRDPQGIGSAITYARRYALMAMVGIAAADDDDDGNAASAKNGSAQTITQDQADYLQSLLVDVNADIPAFMNYFKIAKTVGELPASEFDRAIAALEKKRERS